MQRLKFILVLLPSFILLILSSSATTQELSKMQIFFSTEEDFVTQGPEPADGNPIISDGDLLISSGAVYMRNYELLKLFRVNYDLGLDAVDVIDVEKRIVAFSTELDHPKGMFTAGDLLATNGAIIPNVALWAMFQIPRKYDLGLDAVQFIGSPDAIVPFLKEVKKRSRNYWANNPQRLIDTLKQFGLDIWFSTEGTAPTVKNPMFLDGDLLSAVRGVIVAANSVLLPAGVPAGIPNRGVDFGLDAFACDRRGLTSMFVFSTEILYEGQPAFTDGDVIRSGNGVVIQHNDLIKLFKPKADFLGLDALSVIFRQ
jgi:hypothetical protein